MCNLLLLGVAMEQDSFVCSGKELFAGVFTYWECFCSVSDVIPYVPSLAELLNKLNIKRICLIKYLRHIAFNRERMR
jgi:hypothetical protein